MSRYKAYPEYVPSEVEFLDSLPVGWRALRGKYVFSEYSERSEYGEEQLLSVSEYYGVKPRGEVVEEGDFLSRAESLVGYKKCQKNDLVMNIMLAWKCGLGVSKYDGIVSPAYSVFRFNGNAVPDYMHYLLRTETYTGHFKTRSTGVIDSRLRLYPESFGDVSIILPPAGEQKKIATFLDHETAKIDALIEKQQRLIELLKEKRQAAISHAVTKGLNPNAPMKDSGVDWLGEVPAHWGLPKLINQASRIGDGLHAAPQYEDGTEIYFINGNNLVDGKIVIGSTAKEVPLIEYKKNYIELNSSTVLLSINGTVGNVARYQQEKVVLGKSAAYVNCLDSLLSEYLLIFLQSSNARRYYELEVTGTTIFNLSLGSIRRIRVPLPSKSEQAEIVVFCESQKTKYELLIDKAMHAINLMQERRTALICAAVTGKIDVRDWQAAA